MAKLRRILPFAALWLFLAPGVVVAEEPWGTIWLPEEGIQLRVPGDWRLEYSSGGEGARVVAEEGIVLQVLSWTRFMGVGEQALERDKEGEGAAVAEAEAISRYEERYGRLPRARKTAEVVSADGRPGIVVYAPPTPEPGGGEEEATPAPGQDSMAVEGQGDGGAEDLILAPGQSSPGGGQATTGAGDAFAGERGDTAEGSALIPPGRVSAVAVYVVGNQQVVLTWEQEAGVEAGARERYFPRLAAGISWPHLPAPPPPVVPPVELPALQKQELAGLRVALPDTYRAHATERTLWVSGDNGGYFIFPLQFTGPPPPAESILQAWAEQGGPALEVLDQFSSGSSTWWAAESPTEQAGESGSRLLLGYFPGQETAAILGIWAREARWEQLAPRLAGMLSAAESRGWKSVANTDPAGEAWRDESGQLELRVPAEAVVSGSVLTARGEPRINLQVESDNLVLSWRQPWRPAFRELTPILKSMGEREGNSYREYGEEEYVRILSREGPERFVEYTLEQPLEPLQNAEIRGSQESTLLGGMIPGMDREGAVVRVRGELKGEPRERLYLVATADLPLREGAFRWHGGFVFVEYAPERAAEAAALVQTVVLEARALHPAGATGAALENILTPLRTVVNELEVAAAGEQGWRPLLGEEFAPAKFPWERRWDIQAAVEAWRSRMVGEVSCPVELTEGWWEELKAEQEEDGKEQD